MEEMIDVGNELEEDGLVLNRKSIDRACEDCGQLNEGSGCF
jgi:hypothetical protein